MLAVKSCRLWVFLSCLDVVHELLISVRLRRQTVAFSLALFNHANRNAARTVSKTLCLRPTTDETPIPRGLVYRLFHSIPGLIFSLLVLRLFFKPICLDALLLFFVFQSFFPSRTALHCRYDYVARDLVEIHAKLREDVFFSPDHWRFVLIFSYSVDKSIRGKAPKWVWQRRPRDRTRLFRSLEHSKVELLGRGTHDWSSIAICRYLRSPFLEEEHTKYIQ